MNYLQDIVDHIQDANHWYQTYLFNIIRDYTPTRTLRFSNKLLLTK